MSETHSPEADATTLETQLYSRRWWLIGCIGVQCILTYSSFLYFGVNNDIFARYFELPYAVIDWFALITRPAFWLTSLGFAMMAVLNQTSFRKIALVSTFLSVIASISQIIAYAYPIFYWLLFIGNFLFGILLSYLTVLPVSFAVLWFPDNEIGTALGIKIASCRIGFLFAFVVPSHFMIQMPCGSNIKESFNGTAVNKFTHCKLLWLDQEKWKLIFYAGAISIMYALTLLFLFVFALDQPPKPPTLAQARLRQTMAEQNRAEIWKNLKEFFTETKLLFRDLTFVILVALCAITNLFNYFQGLFLSEIFRPVFRSFFSSSDVDKMNSYLIIGFEISGALGSVISGLFVNRIKNYVLLLRVFLMCCFICWIGVIIGYHFYSIPATFVANILSGLSCGCLYTPIFELATQHTYPRNPMFVTSSLLWSFNVIFVVMVELNRLLLDKLGGLSSLVYIAVVLCISLFLTVFLKPMYRRLEAEKETIGQTKPLLRNDDQD